MILYFTSKDVQLSFLPYCYIRYYIFDLDVMNLLNATLSDRFQIPYLANFYYTCIIHVYCTMCLI